MRIYTDHRNLAYSFESEVRVLLVTKTAVHRSDIRKMVLAQYDYTIMHISGEHNYWKDLLSRWVNVPAVAMKAVAVFASSALDVCVVCVFFPFILDIKFVGRTNRGHTGGRSHRISHPPSFYGACLTFFSREGFSNSFPSSTVRWRSFSTRWTFLFLFFRFLVRKIPLAGIELTSQRVRRLHGYL